MSSIGQEFERALKTGRPPNIVRLFPNSRALIVSGKVIDRAMLSRGKAVAVAANGRNHFVIRGTLLAAQRANAAVIIEIAKSEGGAKAYCAVNYWNIARQVDALCNELGVTVPVAVHADHYGIKGPKDLEAAVLEIPSMFEAGITSIAIDASHLPEDENLLANIRLSPLIPSWAGYETEVGEIKGTEGMSTVEEALFQIQGLNARDIFPDWIALNNGTTHGIQDSEAGIHVELTASIHEALAPYEVSGAQHGTSGNDSERLRRIVGETRTTKANVATALQMITWGVDVNRYGNARLDESGRFVKRSSEGVTDDLWDDMVSYAAEKGWKSGDYKKLNLPFENRLLAQPGEVRERMTEGVARFVEGLIVDVFNSGNTAPVALEAILEAGSHDLGPKGRRIEEPGEWSEEKIREKAALMDRDRGPAGDFDD
jgi:fructose-bisphosphate aldolase, class II